MASRFRIALLLLVCAAQFLSGCAMRPGAALLEPVALEAKPKSVVTVYAASYLSAAPEGSSDDVIVRSELVAGFAKYQISVPQNHKGGHVEIPAGSSPDPTRYFTVVNATPLKASGFYQTINRDLDAKQSNSRDVFVFVHGYNNNYQEALFRLTQLLADSDTQQPTILFAWPSFARLLGYSADRERVMVSRNYLEQVLNDLAKTQNIRNIHLVAHSMGSLLVMETLRQAKFKSGACKTADVINAPCAGAPFLAKLGQVVLLAPDIDLGVFETQLDDVGAIASRIHVVVAKDDLALAASRRLAGGLQRVGNPDPKDKTQLWTDLAKRVDVIELQAINGCDPLNHSNFACVIHDLKEKVRSASLRNASR
jgi:esterase/lipase superfamily enzyme